jgi:aspartate/methionine/tyrosine aminotransferase
MSNRKLELPAPVRAGIAAYPGSRIREVSNIGMGKPGVTALWFGEGDRPTPKFICDAAAQAMAAGRTFYTPNNGTPELRETIAKYATRLHGGPITAERITVTASGVNALMLVMQALVDPGDNVVMVTPVWPNCANGIEIVLSGEVRRVALTPTEQGGWRLDVEKIFAQCDARTKVIFVNSPGNPTGWMGTAEMHRALLEFARRRRIWIVADEVYERLVYDRACAPSALDGATADDPVIQINSFSKSWCMTGWRLGWIVHPPGLAPVLAKITEMNMSGPAMFTQDAGVVAIEQGEPFVKQLVEDYARARDVVVQRLGSMRRVRLARPEAAFYAFFRVDGMTDSLATAKDLLARTGVGMAPGIAFGPEGEGYLRLCFATTPERLSDALDRLAPALS